MLDWLALGTYTFVMSITPGPNNVMVLSSGARFGLRRTLPHLLGITIGFTAQTLAVCAGLGALLQQWPTLRLVMTWCGVAYMAYLAVKLLGLGPVREGQARAQPLAGWQAALFQFVNPKAWVMALTTASVFVPAPGTLLLALAGMAVVLVVVNLACVSVWAAGGHALRAWLAHDGRRTAFNTLMAVLMAWTAWSMLQA